MNKHPQLASCIVVLVMAVIACPAFAQDVTLRYRWMKGDKLRYRFTQQTSTTTTGVPGIGDMTSEQTATQTFSIAVEDVATDGSAGLRQVFEAVRIEVNTPMGKMTFDSENKDTATDDPFGKFLRGVMSAFIGESVTMRSLPNGVVERVEGMTRILDKMATGLPQDPAAAAAFGVLRTSLSDDWRYMDPAIRRQQSADGQGYHLDDVHTSRCGKGRRALPCANCIHVDDKTDHCSRTSPGAAQRAAW
jgi:Family of unknown function (DUF6263)